MKEEATKLSSCLEEPLAPSSYDISLQRAFENYYKVQNLVIRLGLINLLILLVTSFFHYPIVKEISLYSALLFEIIIIPLPYFVYVVVRNAELYGVRTFFDRDGQKWGKFCLNYWYFGGIFGSMVSIFAIVAIHYDSAPRQGTFWEILRFLGFYLTMGGYIQWVWLLSASAMVHELRHDTVNNKHHGTTNYSEAVAGGVPTAYNVAVKDGEDLKDCPV